MSTPTILTYLNRVQNLHQRFEIFSCYSNSVEITNPELLTSADAKVLRSYYNPDVKTGKESNLIIGTELTDKEVEFIKSYRLNNIENPLLKGFFADVLCNGQSRPNNRYVEIIINSYSNWLSQNATTNEDTLDVIKSLMYNGKKYKTYLNIAKQAVCDYLRQSNELWIKRNIIINSYQMRFFTNEEIRVISNECCTPEILDEPYEDNKLFYNILIMCSANLDERNKYYYMLSSNEDIILEYHKSDFIGLKYLLSKYEYLKKGGYNDEAHKCYERFMKAKLTDKGMQIKNTSYITPRKTFEATINTILESKNPIKTFSENMSLLPETYENVLDFQNNVVQNNHIAILALDENSNPHELNDCKSICERQYFVKQYTIKTIIPLLSSLSELIESNVFTFESIISYLKSTWLNNPRQPINPSLMEHKETWIDQIAPSLRLICREIMMCSKTELRYKGDFTCGIDSLTMKLEGCIRDVCRYYNIETVQENHMEIALEKLLKQLSTSKNDNGEEILDIKSLNLIECALLRKGKNLRNKIAHGMTTTADYNINNAIMILHCLLRISTIKISAY